jgi:glucokinase
MYTIGIDVGGTKIAYGLFDNKKNLIYKCKEPTSNEYSPDEFFDNIVLNIENIININRITKRHLRGIGIGMPSFVLYEDGKIIKTANIQKIKDFNARSYLMNKLGSDVRVMLDNDAHTAALAEHRNGAGRGHKHMLYCPVSTGISSGIIIDNQLFRGRYGWAGESGHMIVTPDEGIECGCGNRGCLMSWCSGSMIVKHVQNKIEQGQQSLILKLAGSINEIEAVHINLAWKERDPLAMWAVSQMTKYLAIWLYNLYTTMNINCFVFGGGLLNFGDEFMDEIRKKFDSYNKCNLPVYFKIAELGDDFGIIGAAELLFN